MTESWKHIGLRAALILLVTFVAYTPALRDGFVWDDGPNIVANPALRTLKGLKEIWIDPHASYQYYPLTYTVFWTEYHLWGLRPVGYHVVNILLHALSAILLGLLLSRLSVPGAWLAGLIFAVHPLQVESVAWVTELKNVLSCLFFLGALLAYLDFLERRRWRWGFYSLALLLFLLALLGKTSTVSLPIVILVVLWWKRGRVKAEEVWAVAPFFLAAVPLGLLTTWVEKHYVGAQGTEWQMTLVERCLVAGRVVWFYAGKLVWPNPLMFVYPRWQINAAVWWQYLFPAASAGVLLVFWLLRRRWGKGPFVALLFYVGMVAPVPAFFNLYFMHFSYVSDHFPYLGSMGLIALGAAGVTVGVRNRVARMAVAVPALVVFGTLSWQHCRVFRNEETLWRDTIARNPQCWMAHYNLGNGLHLAGQLQDAIAQYQAALQLKPDYAEAYNNLGLVLIEQGRVQEGVKHLEDALRIWPDCPQAHFNLGNAILLLAGKPEDAIAQYKEALRLSPDDAETHNNLGNALQRAGKPEDAIAQYEEALRLQPDYPKAHNNLGNVFLQTGQIQEAIHHYEQAIRIQPDYFEAYGNLGNALLQAGKPEDAIAQYEKSLQISPDYAKAHYNLGNALVEAGRLNEAIGHYEQVLRIAPDSVEARIRLADALGKTGRVTEAIAQYEQALRLQPDNAIAHYNVGLLYAGDGKLSEAMEQYRQALRLKPDYANADNNLAWLLATAEGSTEQDREQAIQLAKRASELAAGQDAGYLDTLAVAYAAAGRFGEAETNAQKAIELARTGGQTELAGQIGSRLELYRAGRAYHEAGTAQSAPHP